MSKKMPEKQLLRLLEHGTTIQLKGFKKEKIKVNGQVKFADNFELLLKEKSTASGAAPAKSLTQTRKPRTPKTAATFSCPKCATGHILKGKTAYGCSRYRDGCDFRFPFTAVRERAAGRALTRELVAQLLHETL